MKPRTSTLLELANYKRTLAAKMRASIAANIESRALEAYAQLLEDEAAALERQARDNHAPPIVRRPTNPARTPRRQRRTPNDKTG